ncbi:hypothetical protein BGW38_005973, partial [Lunasporangiospora selenospora]
LTRTTIVSPQFEASRARLGVLPGTSISIRTWEEGGSAYKVVREVLDTPWAGPDDGKTGLTNGGGGHGGGGGGGGGDGGHGGHGGDGGKDRKPKDPTRIYIDTDMRQFIAHGLTTELERSNNRFVEIANRAVRQLRILKTDHEIEILRCVSQTTVNVIRAVKDKISVGMRESDVQELLTLAYEASGLVYDDGGSLVLFGKDAALPHGSGNNTKLEKGMMVLIDSGAILHGYLSDITRTFWISRGSNKELNEELDKVWSIVKDAQIAALKAIHPNAACSAIDKAARSLIDKEGYGARFTHRLGHGLGMQGHEEPYLNSGNSDTGLKEGMVFTNEPGIYIEGQYGIRLEDVVLVTKDGFEILSGDLAKSPNEP